MFANFVVPDSPLGPQLAVLVPTVLAISCLVYFGYTVSGLGVGRLLASVRRHLVFNPTIGTF